MLYLHIVDLIILVAYIILRIILPWLINYCIYRNQAEKKKVQSILAASLMLRANKTTASLKAWANYLGTSRPELFHFHGQKANKCFHYLIQGSPWPWALALLISISLSILRLVSGRPYPVYDRLTFSISNLCPRLVLVPARKLIGLGSMKMVRPES